MHLCRPTCLSVWHMTTQQVAEEALHVLDRYTNPKLPQVGKPHVVSHVWGIGRKLRFHLLCQHPVEYGCSGFHQAWPAKPLQCMPMHQIWRLYSRDSMPLPRTQPQYAQIREHNPFFIAILSSRLTQRKSSLRQAFDTASSTAKLHGLAHSHDQSSFTLQHTSQHSHTFTACGTV